LKVEFSVKVVKDESENDCDMLLFKETKGRICFSTHHLCPIKGTHNAIIFVCR